jgi:hypothetical protein
MSGVPSLTHATDWKQSAHIELTNRGKGNPVWGKQRRRRHRMLASQMQSDLDRLAAGQVDAPGSGEPLLSRRG